MTVSRRIFLGASSTAAVSAAIGASVVSKPGSGLSLPGAEAATNAANAEANLYFPGQVNWQDGSLHGRWRTMYNGYGAVRGNDKSVFVRPRTVTNINDTAACLVHTDKSYRDASFEVTIVTKTQLRKNNPPNPWECGWVLWNLRDTDHFYALALKPNGWELTKQDPAYPGAQRFPAGQTGSGWKFPIGWDHHVKVVQKWPTMSVYVDGYFLTSFVDKERPYHGGKIGLYTEDASVLFSDFRVLSGS